MGAPPRYDRAPPKAQEGRVPSAPSALPAVLAVGTADRGPVPARVVALVQPAGGAVVAVGADGALVKLPDGAPHRPLGSRSLSPDRSRAAFARSSGVLVVGPGRAVRHYAVPGRTEEVAWTGPRSVAAGGENASHLLQLPGGALTELQNPRRNPVANAVFGPGGVIRLTSPASEDSSAARALFESPSAFGGPPVLRGVPQVQGWYGAGHAQGRFVARSGTEPGSLADAVFVLDRRTGTVVRALRLEGPGRGKACCPVLGWEGDDALVLASAGSPFRLLRWNIRDGSVRRLTQSADPLLVSLPSSSLGS